MFMASQPVILIILRKGRCWLFVFGFVGLFVYARRRVITWVGHY